MRLARMQPTRTRSPLAPPDGKHNALQSNRSYRSVCRCTITHCSSCDVMHKVMAPPENVRFIWMVVSSHPDQGQVSTSKTRLSASLPNPHSPDCPTLQPSSCFTTLHISYEHLYFISHTNKKSFFFYFFYNLLHLFYLMVFGWCFLFSHFYFC